MKKLLLIFTAFLMTLSICSCGDTSKIDTLIEKENDSQNNNGAAAQTEAVQTFFDQKAAVSETTESSVLNTDDINAAASEYSGEYDVDLTTLPSNMVYGQVYDMFNNPDDYNGKIIHAEGPFSYFKDEETGKEYFAVLIKDATACCAQGIEFVLKGSNVYPYDYPDLETNIAITGVCDIYHEGNGVFCQLLDAEYEIKK